VRLQELYKFKKCNYLIGIRTRDLADCNKAPEQTILPRCACEFDNEHSGSIKWWETIEWLHNGWSRSWPSAES
jgi:hypothetical protein